MYSFWCVVNIALLTSRNITPHQNSYIYFHIQPIPISIQWCTQSWYAVCRGTVKWNNGSHDCVTMTMLCNKRQYFESKGRYAISKNPLGHRPSVSIKIAQHTIHNKCHMHLYMHLLNIVYCITCSLCSHKHVLLT